MHRNFAITDNDKLYIYNITDHYMLLLRQKKHDTLLLLILIYCIRYSDKATINNEPGLSAFATHVATGIGSPRENELMVRYAEADHDAFTTTHAQEEEYATELAAYKLTIQEKNPDEFKELVETYTAKHPFNN